MSRTIYGARAELAGNRERNPTLGKLVQNQRMAVADSTDLDSESCAPFGQTQALDAILEQTSMPQFQVKLPSRDLCKVRDQPCTLYMFLRSEELGLTLQIQSREGADLYDEMGE